MANSPTRCLRAGGKGDRIEIKRRSVEGSTVGLYGPWHQWVQVGTEDGIVCVAAARSARRLRVGVSNARAAAGQTDPTSALVARRCADRLRLRPSSVTLKIGRCYGHGAVHLYVLGSPM